MVKHTQSAKPFQGASSSQYSLRCIIRLCRKPSKINSTILKVSLLKRVAKCKDQNNHIFMMIKIITYISSSHHSSMKIGVLKNFAKFTGKRLCQSLFLN